MGAVPRSRRQSSLSTLRQRLAAFSKKRIAAVEPGFEVRVRLARIVQERGKTQVVHQVLPEPCANGEVASEVTHTFRMVTERHSASRASNAVVVFSCRLTRAIVAK